MKPSNHTDPARRPRSVKRTILLVVLGVILVVVVLLGLRIYRALTTPYIYACGAITVRM